MSVVFVPKRQRGKAQINQETIQRVRRAAAAPLNTVRSRSAKRLTVLCFQLLDENDQLVRCIAEYLQKGRATECVQYQQILHRNIVYLGTIADASPDLPDATTASCEEAATPNGTTENSEPSNRSS
ncbi:SS18-like protein 2 isoform X1 [Pygocentrus nattereri]|uniref:SS18-like protein 2 isoform X1 n=1 Tax=Pygocentrus nattereri TaxID=42514 RepID=UPI000814A983|nr:SS18-like protein 2 isoform X1 [Pygocentrus nattereri]